MNKNPTSYNKAISLEARWDFLNQKIWSALKNIWIRIFRGSFILLILYTLMYLLAVASYLI